MKFTHLLQLSIFTDYTRLSDIFLLVLKTYATLNLAAGLQDNLGNVLHTQPPTPTKPHKRNHDLADQSRPNRCLDVSYLSPSLWYTLQATLAPSEPRVDN